MRTAKLFFNGGSQAVRLPKGFRFEGDEVCVTKWDEMVILYPPGRGWKVLEDSLEKFTDDFMAERRQPRKSERRKKL